MNRLVRLSVRNTLPFPRRNEPVSTGLPLPREAALDNPDDLALYDEDGNRVPAQFVPLAWWDDGIAVKWMLLHFRADAGANAECLYDLVREPAMIRDVDGGTAKLIAVETPTGVLLETGVWRGTVGKGIPILDDMQVKVDGVWRPVLSAPGGLYGTVLASSGENRLMTGKPRECVVEDNGQERAIVKIVGSYIPERSNGETGDLTYEIRIEAYRDRADLRITHTLIAGLHGAEFAELSFRLPMEIVRCAAGSENVRVCSFDPVVPDGPYGVLQHSEYEYFLGKLVPDEETRERGRHDWWIAARNQDVAVFATIRHFHQKYPKSLERIGTELIIGLLPSLSEAKDSYAPANQTQSCYSLTGGEARTHEFLFSFCRPDEDVEAVCRMSSAFHNPMMALAPWDWYTGSGALGDLFPRSDKYADYEKAVDETLTAYLGRREELRLYGDRNFGDDQYGQPGIWNNGEYDYAHVGMLHFLRGAGRDWFERFALPAARHLMDIDVCHAGPHAGKVHQHSVRHNSETPKLGSHAWIRGLLEYYCFSGDLRARDVAVQVAETWSSAIMDKGVTEGTERGITWPVISMLAIYDTFPEPKYLEAASVLIRTVLECHDPVEGDFKGTMSRPTTKNNWGTFVIGSPVLEALVMYYQTTGDVRVKETIVRAARRLARLNWMDDLGAWEYTHSMLTGEERVHNAKTDKMVTPAVLYGYLYSEDEELLDKARSAFACSQGIASGTGKDIGQSYCFGVRIPALLERADSMKR